MDSKIFGLHSCSKFNCLKFLGNNVLQSYLANDMYCLSKNGIVYRLKSVADPDIRNIRRCECQIFRKLFSYKKMTIDKKINRTGKTYCNDSPIMAPQSVILLVTLRK